jgi:hypothetical protein
LEKPRVLSDAAGILIQSGAQKRGVEVAIQAQVAAMSISDAWHKVAALSDVIKALIQTGSQTQAREMAHQALAVVTREQPPALVPLKQVERNLTQIGRFGRSLAARAALLGNKRETQMLDRAVWSLTLAGGSSQALAVAEEIRERWHKAEALGRVAEVLALLGEQDGLKRALAAAEPIWDAQHRVYALCVVARALAKAGSQERAVSVTDKALAATEYIQDENVRIDALSRVARTLALIEPPSQALLVWSKGLVEAKAAGLHSVFSILKEGAALIAAIDNGQKLWSIYETVIEVEEWW